VRCYGLSVRFFTHACRKIFHALRENLALPCNDLHGKWAYTRNKAFVVRWFLSLPCRLSLSLFNRAFPVRSSLPCVSCVLCHRQVFVVHFLIVHGKAFFVVWGLTTKNSCTTVPVFPVVLAPRLRCNGSATFRAHRQCCAILPSPSSNPHVCCLSRRPVGLHLTLPSSGPSTSLHNAPSRLSITSGLHLTSPWIMVQVACTPRRPARIPIAPLYLGELMYFARSNLERKFRWETL
jgi:hypothetical protein